jgi:peptidoglycan/LPS O-acetylase OafA/YrhL
MTITRAGSRRRPDHIRRSLMKHLYPLAAPAYVGEIDALRAVAVTMVFALHCGLFDQGWTGVWLFFVISGFAITSSLVVSDHIEPSRPQLLRNFFARRCLRIWPLYFVFVAVNMIAAAVAGRGDVLESGQWLATFTYNYRMILHPETWPTIPHLWTISIEQQFYLLFPLLFAFLSRRWLFIALWSCIILAPALRAALVWWLQPQPWNDTDKFLFIYFFAPAHFDAFAAGALIALARPYFEFRWDNARFLLLLSVCAALTYSAIYWIIDTNTTGLPRCLFCYWIWGEGRQIWVYSIIVALSASGIALILAGEGWLIKACRFPLLQPIGRISYGAYVYHVAVLILIDTLLLTPETRKIFWIASVGKFAVGYPLTLLIAFMSYRYLEAPILRLRKRFA